MRVVLPILLLVLLSACGRDPSPPADPAGMPVPTGPLPETLVPDRFEIELRIDPREKRFSGRSRIEGRLDGATDTLWLHGKDQDIESATLRDGDGEVPLSVEQAHVSGVLRLTAPRPIAAGPVSVELDYSAPFNRQLEGAYKLVHAGEAYVMTQMEPLGARLAFPGLDEPRFKRPWDITLVVPESMNAVANTAAIEETAPGDGFKRIRFARTENLPSYLIAFAVGPWDIVEWDDIAPNEVRARPLPLRGIAAQGRGEDLTYALAHSGEVVAALERYFGIPYPFDKLDILAAPDFSAGAMENAGLITYRDSLLFIHPNSPTGQRQGYWGVHAHELAHQWFGNLVTMPWWDDLWLNEAFATWMGNRIVDELQPGFNVQRARQDAAVFAMDGDSLASTRRIREPITEFTEIAAAFDGITYRKGGAVLAMFEHYLGAGAFQAGIRQYLHAHARGNARSDDLIAALAQQAADPAALAAAFASFLDQPGVPFLRLHLDCEAARPTLQIAQSRYLPVGSPAAVGQRWSVPLCVRYGQGEDSFGQCSLIAPDQTELVLEQAQGCPDWLMPNADGAGYYRFALAPADQARLDAAFDRLGEAEQRMIADSLDAAFRAGTLDAEGYLASVPKIAAAPARQTALAPLEILEWLLEHHARDQTERTALRARVAAVYGPRLDALGREPRPGDSDDDRLLRAGLMDVLADFARDPGLGAALAADGRRVLGLDGTGTLQPDAVAPDQRALALKMAAVYGDAASFEAMARAFRDAHDSLLRGQLLSALGRFTDPELAARARALSLEDGTRSNEVAVVLANQVGEAALRDAARAWLRDNYEALMAKGPRGLGGGFVQFDAAGRCDPAEADDIEAWHGPRLREVEGGPRRVAQAVERIRLCAALKAAQARPAAAAAGQSLIRPVDSATRPPGRQRAARLASSSDRQAR